MAAQIVQQSAWIIPLFLLFIVACNRFNSPPTNRSGTTFALFSFGVIFYYALVIALWLLVIIGLRQGGIALAWVFGKFQMILNPQAAQEQFAQYAPIFAALIIVVASQFRGVLQIDTAARAFCVNLAAIPREADRLAVELSQSADFRPSAKLRDQLTKLISQNIGPQALNFSRDGTLPARFTRAVALYLLFIGPKHGGELLFPANSHSRAVYARIMHLGDDVAARTDRLYEELMQRALAYFSSAQPAKELREALSYNIAELSNLVCSLVARFVLCCEVSHIGRRQRLSGMGFDPTHPTLTFGPNQWATTILGVIVLSIGMMVLMPGVGSVPPAKILVIAVTFGLSIGFAVLGAIVVAQRFVEKQQEARSAFPPIAELTLAALIVTGLSLALRIGIPIVPVLIAGDGAALQVVLADFLARLPGVLIPFVCTISLGLLCSHVGSLNWNWQRAAVIGALWNGFAFGLAGLVVALLLDPQVIIQFYLHPNDATRLIPLTSGIIGMVVGGMVLAVFNRSEHVRKDIAARVADRQQNGKSEFALLEAALDIDVNLRTSASEAARHLGGYTRANVEELEGRYVCFRPAFDSTGVINAYLIVVRWDDATSCLVFEERERVDAGHAQSGRVYIPDGRPYMSLVTVERGAMRLIMVSRPEGREPARGLILTLMNPRGTHSTPASAPIVLRRIVEETPQLGFIRPQSPEYEAYRRELEMVFPAYAFFASMPIPVPATEKASAKSEEPRLSVVR